MFWKWRGFHAAPCFRGGTELAFCSDLVCDVTVPCRSEQLTGHISKYNQRDKGCVMLELFFLFSRTLETPKYISFYCIFLALSPSLSTFLTKNMWSHVPKPKNETVTVKVRFVPTLNQSESDTKPYLES